MAVSPSKELRTYLTLIYHIIQRFASFVSAIYDEIHLKFWFKQKGFTSLRSRDNKENKENVNSLKVGSGTDAEWDEFMKFMVPRN